jgi:hypothetical protein
MNNSVLAQVIRLDDHRPQTPAKVEAISSDEKRASVRTKFHYSGRPNLVIEHTYLSILNISRTGLKLVSPIFQTPGSSISGWIRHNNQNTIYIEGKVMRVVGNLVAVQFDNMLSQKELDYIS